jgi:hypothetical protein
MKQGNGQSGENGILNMIWSALKNGWPQIVAGTEIPPVEPAADGYALETLDVGNVF